jgi:hypothetical protein
VRWRWLLLLIGLVAASIVFLIGTIIKTSRSGVAVMKSDACKQIPRAFYFPVQTRYFAGFNASLIIPELPRHSK